MGENQKLLNKALEQTDSWLAEDFKESNRILEILTKISNGEGVVLGGEIQPIDGKILIATGGTSGKPKFAIHTWDTLSAAARSLMERIGENIQSCGILPLHHVSGFMPVVRAIISGGKYIQGDPRKLIENPNNKCLSLVPTQLSRFLQNPTSIEKLQRFRMIFVGGAKIEEALLDEAQKLKLPIAPSYGMTETAAMVTLLHPDEFRQGQRGCGKPLPGVEISFKNDRQILITANSLQEGYVGKASMTSRLLETKDAGYFDELGSLHITGRLDRVIISGGENVDPAEVENELKKLQYVEEALVVGVPDPEWGQKVVAFVVGEANEPENIKLTLRENLPNYKIPKAILVREELPLDDRGKVDWSLIKTLNPTFPA